MSEKMEPHSETGKRKEAPEGEDAHTAVLAKTDGDGDVGSAKVAASEAVIEELVRQREEKRANKCVVHCFVQDSEGACGSAGNGTPPTRSEISCKTSTT